MPSILSEIQAALDSFDFDLARKLLSKALKEEPSAQVYYSSSLVALNSEQRMNFLKKALEMDPNHKLANDELKSLNKPHALAISSGVLTPNPAPVLSSQTQSFVEGEIIISETQLFEIPSSIGPVTAKLYEGSSVIILARTEKTFWFNVLYLGSTGQYILGWIQSKYVANIRCNRRKVELLDLPITEFQWNTRADIDAVINQKRGIEVEIKNCNRRIGTIQGEQNVSGIGCVLSILGLIVGLLWIASIGATRSASTPTLVLLGSVAIGGLAFLGRRNSSKMAKEKESLVANVNDFTEELRILESEIPRLKRLRESKKSSQERAAESELANTALRTALDVGASVIKRWVPNRSETITRNK